MSMSLFHFYDGFKPCVVVPEAPLLPHFTGTVIASSSSYRPAVTFRT